MVSVGWFVWTLIAFWFAFFLGDCVLIGYFLFDFGWFLMGWTVCFPMYLVSLCCRLCLYSILVFCWLFIDLCVFILFCVI